jgi:RimJ/RimL family protein N-acetyltransferase
MKIDTQKIFLRLLNPEDVGQYYVDWMNDPDVVRYLESRWHSYTLEDVKDYVRRINDSPNDFLFGIFLTKTNQHIGNIKIGEINHTHRFGNVGIIIGEKKYWGKGFGTQSISLATKIAFQQLNLNSLTAGVYSSNDSSYRAFLNAGWEEVGRYKKYRFFEGEFIDQIIVQKCHDMYNTINAKKNNQTDNK